MLGDPMKALFGLHWGRFAQSAILILFIVTIWPAVMKAALKEETV